MTPLRAFTKLLVLDLKASAAFYQHLGFTPVGTDGTFTHLRWGEQGDVLLVGVPSNVRFDGKKGWGVLLCFRSEQPVDGLAERARAIGAPVQGPDVQPWHSRDIVITDPDGYRLNFFEPA